MFESAFFYLKNVCKTVWANFVSVWRRVFRSIVVIYLIEDLSQAGKLMTSYVSPKCIADARLIPRLVCVGEVYLY